MKIGSVFFVEYKRLGKRIRYGPPATKKFDMQKEPTGQHPYFVPFLHAGTKLRKKLHKVQLEKVNMDGVEPPYLLLCNHNSFYDFYIMTACIAPHTGNYPAAVDDFIGREFWLRNLGGIPKRKFAVDIGIVRTARKIVKKGEMFGLYPEARYSLCGVTEVIPDAVGQLAKFLGVPVVTFKMMGHHIYNPYWNTRMFRWLLPTQAVMTQLFTAEELKNTSAEEVNAKIREALYNDDWRWQSENRVAVKNINRAKGLHNVLYQCPACHTEYEMASKGAKIFCKHCGKRWTLNHFGELNADNGSTEFKFPSDWYKWEREQVKKEVDEGRYHFECDCDVNDLPNADGFIYMGKGKLVHTIDGFSVHGTRKYDGVPFEMVVPALQQYACHIEYKYRFGWKRDCINLNTPDDTWYVFPENCKFSVTKIALATEEIYKKQAALHRNISAK